MKVMLTIFLVATIFVARAEDMQEYLRKTVAMAEEGKHKESLQRFIWFHDHALEHDEGMYGVRLSFALRYWSDLGKVYPPAKAALIETRNRKEKALLEDGDRFELFHDFVALNEVLEEEDKIVALFDAFDQKQPKAAKENWNLVRDTVVAAKRLDLVRKYMGKPLEEFSKIEKVYEESVSLYEHPQLQGEAFKLQNERLFVQESLKLMELVLALGDQEMVKKIRAKALLVLDDDRLREGELSAGE